MPSPLAHSMAGYVIYRLYRPWLPEPDSKRLGPIPLLLLVTIGLSMLPDLDSVAGILMGDFGRFHNNMTHSLLVGLIVALGVGSVGWVKQRADFFHWFILTLLCYEFHVMMDFLTTGRGVMAFWPFSSDRFLSPVAIFYGLHWSNGVFSVKHLWTLFTESALVLPLALTIRFLTSPKWTL